MGIALPDGVPAALDVKLASAAQPPSPGKLNNWDRGGGLVLATGAPLLGTGLLLLAAEKEPTKYWLSTLPPNITLRDLVDAAKLRWRVERDYQELKQEVGLGHFEGRGWRGFHHHARCASLHTDS